MIKKFLISLLIVIILCNSICFSKTAAVFVGIKSNTTSSFKQYFNILEEALLAAERHDNKPSKKLLTAVCYLEYTFSGVPRITLLRNISYQKDLLQLKNITLDLKRYTLTVSHKIELINSALVSTDLQKNGGVVLLDTNTDEADILNSIHLVNSTLQKIDVAVNSSTHPNYRLISVDGSCVINQCNFSLTGTFVNKAYSVYVNSGQYLSIQRSSITADISLKNQFVGIFCYGDTSVINCDLDISVSPTDSSISLSASACYCRSTGFADIVNSNMYVRNYSCLGKAYTIYASSALEVLNVEGGSYIADSHYLADSSGYLALGIGIITFARYTFVNDVFVHGNHSGMQISGEGYITRSTFESTGHGGIYFAHSAKTTDRYYIYVSDSEIRHCLPSGIFADDVSNPNYSADNRAAFYIGGSATGCHISVLMDNCIIEGDKYSGVLRGSSKEHDNELFISNSQVKAPIRKDNTDLTLTIGEGMNITKSSTLYFKYKLTTYETCGDSSIYFTDDNYRIIPDFIDKKALVLNLAEMR